MSAVLTLCEPLSLSGTWSLRRRLHDRLSGAFGTAMGSLTITPEGDWIERGTLDLDRYRGPFERRLLIRNHDDGWWLTFADGRAFHPWRTESMVEHPCRADLYRGYLTVDAAGRRLRTWWDVTGPAKSQRLLTEFRREDPS